MIAGTLDDLDRYAPVHARFARAIAWIRKTDLSAFAPGRHPIDSDELYVSIDHKDGRGREGAKLEAHRKYIDIQVTLSGDEEIGWTPLAECRQAEAEYSAERDIVFFRDAPRSWVKVPPRSFAIFFPEDAHAPLGGHGALRKAIVKVRV